MSPEPGPSAVPGGSIAAPDGTAPTVGRDAVSALLTGVDLRASRLEFVAKASTCEVWRAATPVGPTAVRILAPRPGRPGDLDADVALRRALAARGAAVAAPLFDHRSRPELAVADHGPAWVVDRWVAGAPADAPATEAVWHELGALLAVLHALPVRGHGRLRIVGDRLDGRRDDPRSGIADRFDFPWPFDGRPLSSHPLAEADPGLIPRLQRVEGAIRAAADAAPVIAHADLNGANLRHAGGRLHGLLDFADASVLAPAWDFASLRHFQGADAVARTLAGYTADADTAGAFVRDARLLALVIALHHLCRAKILGLPARRAAALDRLRRGLDEIGVA